MNIDYIFKGTGRSLTQEAKDAILSKHYLKRMPSISFSFTATNAKGVAAVATFGVPGSRHLQKSACATAPDKVLELNRLWVHPSMPKNTASFFLSRCLKDLEEGFIIVSYADTKAGHLGYVYRAANFNYAGWTDMDRKTPRFDYVPRNGKHSRDAFRSNDFDRVRREVKIKYWTVTGSPTVRRALLKIATWPKLSWKTLPPPVAA